VGGDRLRERREARRAERHGAGGCGAARRDAPPAVAVPVENVVGAPEARGATIAGAQVHSVRLPSFVVSTEVVFAADGERLTIRHDAGETPAPYVAGTLRAIRAVPGRVGLTRGLDRLLGEGTAQLA
jgi:4-hydroxy-tetrahydrodipicolinate reductase